MAPRFFRFSFATTILAMALSSPVFAVEFSGNIPLAKKAYPALKMAYCTWHAPGDVHCDLTAVRVIQNWAMVSWTQEEQAIEGPAIGKLSGKAWKIVMVGGGAMDSKDVIQAGVPRAIAEQLAPMHCPMDDEALSGYSAWNLMVCRNIPYANHGRAFTYKPLKDYFSSWPWYRPNPNFHDGMLSAAEKSQAERIFAYEKKMGYL